MKLKMGDILIIAIVLLCAFTALLPFLGGSDATKAEIYKDGKLLYTVDLKKDQILEVEEKYHNVIEVKNGKIHFKESNCPDKVCVRSGYASKGRPALVCLPNRVVIKLLVSDGEVDLIVG